MSEFKDNIDDETVTLTLENDEVMECAVLAIYNAAGKQYIALLPLDENGEEKLDSDVYLYRYHEEKGEPVLENIDNDDEYEAAADGFDEWMDTLEFDDFEDPEDLEDLENLDGGPDPKEE